MNCQTLRKKNISTHDQVYFFHCPTVLPHLTQPFLTISSALFFYFPCYKLFHSSRGSFPTPCTIPLTFLLPTLPLPSLLWNRTSIPGQLLLVLIYLFKNSPFFFCLCLCKLTELLVSTKKYFKMDRNYREY